MIGSMEGQAQSTKGFWRTVSIGLAMLIDMNRRDSRFQFEVVELEECGCVL